MPSQEKFATVARIKDDLQAAEAVWIVDYRGLSVKQSEELRAQIRKIGAQLKIYKNSLTEIALADLQMPALGEVLEGPSAFVFASGDPVESAKVLKAFAKANDSLQIKGGLFNQSPVNAQQVVDIADLPSREELIGHVLAVLDSPVRDVVAAIDASAPIFGLLDAIEEKAA
jgi:large subunit ribosomal protein L10